MSSSGPATAKDEVDIQVFLQSGPVTASAAGVTRTNLKVNSEIAVEELSMLMETISIMDDEGEHIIKPRCLWRRNARSSAAPFSAPMGALAGAW